ncbi:UNVERIFIED_CONTAM: flagellar protein FlbD [Brevibacillus sp. OAP136]
MGPPTSSCERVGQMIELTRLSGGKFFLNITHIEVVEATPDTVITLLNGKKLLVKEPAKAIAEQITAFYQKANSATVIPRPEDDDSIV